MGWGNVATSQILYIMMVLQHPQNIRNSPETPKRSRINSLIIATFTNNKKKANYKYLFCHIYN